MATNIFLCNYVITEFKIIIKGKMKRDKLDLVLVTYNPDYKVITKLLNSIIEQVRYIYIVDNTSGGSSFLDDFLNEKVRVIYLEDNKGISYAQNIGIKESLKNRSDFIMLSDQDTFYPSNYVSQMLEVFNKEEKVAAVAPLFKDINQKNINEGFIQKGFFGFNKIYPDTGLHSVFQAIASGKILNTKYLIDIGYMNENLFIDWVDLEWCWRAINKGYKIIGNADVLITHQLGDNARNIGFREVNIRSYIRHYYITRNAFYLALRNNDLDILHKVTLFFKSFRYIIAFPILSKPHLKHLKYVLLGFWHGLTGNLGKLK